MARIVAAFGSSHSPALNSPAEDFAGHARRDEQYLHHLDREGRKVSYEDLLRSADSKIKDEIGPAKIGKRVDACRKHLDRLAGSIAGARLDALIVVGDDQREQYLDDNLPAFLVYCGKSIANSTLDLPQGAPEYWRRARSIYHEPEAPREYPAAPELASFLVKSLIENDFDVSFGASLPRPRGEGHAFGFVHRRLMAAGVIPIVPLVVNTYYPPNQPTPRRCFSLGSAIRKAVEAWKEDARIGILASGGLSHFTIDETLDRGVLAAGNLEMAWQAYEPLYRTPAGTGCGMAFAAWG
jgi:3-O-methylgallate 3,4-dioxygenase